MLLNFRSVCPVYCAEAVQTSMSAATKRPPLAIAAAADERETTKEVISKQPPHPGDVSRDVPKNVQRDMPEGADVTVSWMCLMIDELLAWKGQVEVNLTAARHR